MAKQLKLTKLQKYKIEMMEQYFKSTKDNIFVGDNDAFYSNVMDNIKLLKTKIVVKYYNFTKGGKESTDIVPKEITEIYRCALKNDEDFKKYVSDIENLSK